MAPPSSSGGLLLLRFGHASHDPDQSHGSNRPEVSFLSSWFPRWLSWAIPLTILALLGLSLLALHEQGHVNERAYILYRLADIKYHATVC